MIEGHENVFCVNATISPQMRCDRPWVAIRMADAAGMHADWGSRDNLVEELDLVFNDVDEDSGGMHAPVEKDAAAIWDLIDRHSEKCIIVQCPTGTGRSLAVQAAVVRSRGKDDWALRASGNYNRTLYEHLLRLKGLTRENKLVSMLIHAVHPPEFLLAFMLCMQRQRYPAWEVVAVIDSNERLVTTDWQAVLQRWGEDRLKLIPVKDAFRFWGHPYRQQAIDAARGHYIGLSNSDNYYVPGYFEQMVEAMEAEDADFASCSMLHNYWNWEAMEGVDLGHFIATADLVRQVPFSGTHHTYDQDFIAALREKAKKAIHVQRVLYVHN